MLAFHKNCTDHNCIKFSNYLHTLLKKVKLTMQKTMFGMKRNMQKKTAFIDNYVVILLSRMDRNREIGENLICIGCTFFSIYLACYSWCPLRWFVSCLRDESKNMCVFVLTTPKECQIHMMKAYERKIFIFRLEVVLDFQSVWDIFLRMSIRRRCNICCWKDQSVSSQYQCNISECRKLRLTLWSKCVVSNLMNWFWLLYMSCCWLMECQTWNLFIWFTLNIVKSIRLYIQIFFLFATKFR